MAFRDLFILLCRPMKIRSLLRLRRKLWQKFAKIETSHFGFLSLKNFALRHFLVNFEFTYKGIKYIKIFIKELKIF